MKKYTIQFQGQKLRSRVDRQNSKPVTVDEWEETIQSNASPAIWQLTDFVYPKHGIPGIHFNSVSSQPGMFTASQLENNRGSYDSKGRYFAQIFVQITISRNTPSAFRETFGLPPVP